MKGVEADYPLGDIVAALDFPATTDRNKAAALIAYLAEKFPHHRELIRAKAVPTLLRLLELRQPNNHEFAYAAMKTLSGKDFGARSYNDWKLWAQESQR